MRPLFSSKGTAIIFCPCRLVLCECLIYFAALRTLETRSNVIMYLYALNIDNLILQPPSSCSEQMEHQESAQSNGARSIVNTCALKLSSPHENFYKISIPFPCGSRSIFASPSSPFIRILITRSHQKTFGWYRPSGTYSPWLLRYSVMPRSDGCSPT